ncbi:MAG: hypothetical protein ACYDBQ_11445 [Thermoplasmatota archaeon]
MAVLKKGIWTRWQTPRLRVPARRLEEALRAKRPRAWAGAVALFVGGFTLDDLHVLRAPAYLVGMLLAVAAIAAGPLWLAHRFAFDHQEESAALFAARCRLSRRTGYLTLLGVAVGALVWLSLFSAGVPAWAA